MGREINDDDIADVERKLIGVSLSDVLWGGPRGDGLVHTVAHLAESVKTLGQSMTIMQERVSGEKGLASEMYELRKEFDEAVRRRDEMHKDNRDERTRWRLLVGAPCVSGLAWLVCRSVYITMTGHLPGH